MFDEDTYKEIKAEDKAYKLWETGERNRILGILNPERKQEAWNKLFPKPDYSSLSEEELNQPY